MRTHDEFTWVALLNSRPQDPSFSTILDTTLWRAFEAVTEWPERDLFDRFE